MNVPSASSTVAGTDGPQHRGRRLATLCLLAGILLGLPLELYSSRQSITEFRLLDHSWQYSMPVLLRQGQLSGRDFIYTYGPLYQLTHALGLLIPPGDLAQVIRFSDLPEVVLVLLGVWWLLGQMGTSAAVRGALFLAWALLLTAAWDFFAGQLKPMAGPPLVAVAALALRRATLVGGVRARLVAAAAWGAAPVLLTLYSFEFGILALGALGLTAAALLMATFRLHGPATASLRFSVVICLTGSVVGAALFAGLVPTLPGFESYLSDSFSLVAAYSQIMSLPIEPSGMVLLLLSSATGMFVIVTMMRRIRAVLRHGKPLPRAEFVLMAIGFLAVVMIRYGLTRSDLWHVYAAVTPSVLLLTCLLPGWWQAHKYAPAGMPWWLLPALIYALDVATPHFQGSWSERLQAFRRLELRTAGVSIDDDDLSAAVTAARQAPGRSLLVWPFGAMVNLLADKRNPCYTLQVFEGAIGNLEPAAVSHLDIDGNPPVLMFRRLPEQQGLGRFTHNSLVFRHLLDHYQLAEPPRAGFLLLAHAEPAWENEPLTEEASFAPVDGQRVALPLDAFDVRASDIIQFRLSVETSIAPLSKAGVVELHLLTSDGRRFIVPIMVPADGQPHEVLASCLDLADPMLVSAFQPGRWWRSTERVTALQLAWLPQDWMSRTPSRVRCEQLTVLHRPNVETRETPLGEQASAEHLNWCFGP